MARASTTADDDAATTNMRDPTTPPTDQPRLPLTNHASHYITLQLDSPLFMFELMYKFWAHSPSDGAAFFIANMDEIKSSVHALVDLMVVEQHHFRDSPYYYKPLPGQFRDGTGLVWSFARPSDDQTTLGYNIPQNLFAVSVVSASDTMQYHVVK